MSNSREKEKMCNMCGEMVLRYSVYKNAPLCADCVPVQTTKKIPNEADMLKKILEGKKENA